MTVIARRALLIAPLLLPAVAAAQPNISRQPADQTTPEDLPITAGVPGTPTAPTNPTAGRPEVQQPTSQTQTEIEGGLLARDRLLGDPFGARSFLEDRGLIIDSTLVFDFSRNFRGGLDTAGSANPHLFDLNLTLDTEKAFGLTGGTLFADFQNQSGTSISDEVGDFAGVDNIATDGRTQLSEIFYGQDLLDGRLTVRVGKIDSNADFAVAVNALEFVNSSPGQSPTIFVMNAYPDGAFGAEVFVTPTPSFYVKAGIFDGAAQEGIETGDKGPRTLFGKPADLFLIAQTGFEWSGGAAGLAGRAGVGYWYGTGTFDRFAGGTRDGTGGPFFVLDQTLYRENPADAEDAQGVGVYLQYGYADPSVSETDHHGGAGVVWTGLLPGRDADVIGVGASYVHLSGAAGFEDDAEIAVEAFYRLQLTPWFAVKPDVQYVINPGGAGLADAVVGTLRLEMAF